MWQDFVKAISGIIQESGFANMTPLHLVMILIACVFLYLAIVKKYEPLLLVPYHSVCWQQICLLAD